MHSVDPTTEQMIRSVLAYAENRLRLDPVPLDKGSRDPADLDVALAGLLGDNGHNPDQVLGVYASVLAPAVISADSPRFLGFIPAAPTKASLLFDMLISCASIQGISWLEAAGAIHAENQVLRLIADRAGLPPAAGGCFVSGGSAANLSALAVAREAAKRRLASPPRLRVVVGSDAHSSIGNTLRLLEMDALVVPTADHRLTAGAVRVAIEADGDPRSLAAIVATSGTTNAGIIDDLAGLAAVAAEHNLWFHVDGAYGGAGLFAPSVRSAFAGVEHADSFVVDPHKWLFAPYDCCALLYRDPEAARAAHAQGAAYLDPIDREAENPADLAIHLSRRARGLPFWFSLATHGTDRYGAAIERTLETTRTVAEAIRASDHLDLVCEPELSVLLFERLGWDENAYAAWSNDLAKKGEILCLPTKWHDRTVLRLAFVNPDTQAARVIEVLATLS